MIIQKEEAKEILMKGGNVVIPTETVYGLAGSIKYPEAIKQIYTLKKRPQENPLILHGATLSQILDLVGEVPQSFFLLADHFWPGPLTLILEAKKGTHPLITAGLSTVGVRIPNHLSTLSLLEETGPLAAPSANLSGKPSSTHPSHVEKDFGIHFPILEGPPPLHGLESTILGWIEGSWQILRYGSLLKESVEEVLKHPLIDSSLPICPGKRFKHYSPEATLFCAKGRLSEAEGIIGYENRSYPSALPFYSLGRDDEPASIAHNLFATLRQIDEDRLSKVWVDIDLPKDGLYATILERITRAMQQP